MTEEDYARLAKMKEAQAAKEAAEAQKNAKDQ